MILVRDLGFLFSLVLVVVGWFVARRKWRRVATRREEIRRLMMLASEETARAELEATVLYGSYKPVQAAPVYVSVSEEPKPVLGVGTGSGSTPVARQVQHHCKVCFSPTTTRCKQCKAVRYCSRKCQIIHWRDGHKDECLSFVLHRNIDRGPQSRIKEFKQDEIQSSQNVVGSEIIRATKPVESHSGELLFSDPVPLILDENNDTETRTSDDWNKTDINVKELPQSLPVHSSSSTNSVDVAVTLDCESKDCDGNDGKSSSINVEPLKPLLPKLPNLTNPVYGVAASSDSIKRKSGYIDMDEMSESSTSSRSGATDSEEPLFAITSTTLSSDFWGGSVKPTRSKISTFDESADVSILKSHSANLPSPGNVNVETLAWDTDRDIRDSCPPTSILNKSRELSEPSEDDSRGFQSSGRINGHIENFDYDTNKVVQDDPFSSTSLLNKSTGSSELSADVSMSQGPLLLSCKLPSQDSVGNTVVRCGPMEEAKLSSSARRRHASEGDNASHKQDAGNLSTPPKELRRGVDGRNGNLDAGKRNESSRPRVSETIFSNSCSEKPILEVPCVRNGFIPTNVPFASCNRCYLCSAKSGTNASTRRVVGQIRASNFIRNGSLGAENGIREQQEGGSFSYELFVKLYNWNKVEFFPCGLINCGNSCFANAVLQCLAFTPPLTAYFLQGLHTKACKPKEWCFTCELEALVKKAKEGKTLISPDRIMSQMQHIGRNLSNGKEEDAHEFLRYAIEAMQSACLKETGINTPNSLNEETTLLGLTFGGYIQSKIECLGCGTKTKQHERIMDLTVEIGGEIGSLEDALRQFTRSEILDGENKYHCSRCHSYQMAKKKLRVLEAPNVLTIALKRFQSGKYGKLNKAVKFPEILNLAKYMSETNDKSPIYQLFGVVVHLDVMNATFSGHYVCYVKDNQRRWYKADDSVVQKVELEKVLSQDAYMLFYSRCSPRAPRPIRSLMAGRDKKARANLLKSCLDEPWDVQSCHTCPGCVPENHTTHHLIRTKSEIDSDNSSLFSELRSYSTDSSNGESTSTNDNFDQMFGETRDCWNPHCRSNTDSDTTSSSSSSPSSTWSSLHPRHSPLSNMDRYSSDNNDSNNSDSGGFWAGSNNTKVGSPDTGRGNSCSECKNDKKLDNDDRLGSHNHSHAYSRSRGVHI